MAKHDALTPDWDPRSEAVMRDQRAAYDEMREKIPVAYSELMQWSVFRHADVMRILRDPETFSNAVSRHVSVPNSMDGEEHASYRALIEPYFSEQRMAFFKPLAQRIVDELLEQALPQGTVEWIDNVALPFAVQVQCAFLGWPKSMHHRLIDWVKSNHQATLAQDRPKMSQIAAEFIQLVDDMLTERKTAGAGPDDDITASLMHEVIGDRTLNDEEIASILRNWTVGEIGTISASIGILVRHVAAYPDLQAQLRAEPELLEVAVDEMLRLFNPLVASRRITTRPVEVGGRMLPEGARISINWMSANRDPRVFNNPYEFSWDRDPSLNLLYGHGVHVCPGAPLARLQMKIFMEHLLANTTNIRLVPGQDATYAVYPASGYATLPIELT